MALTAAAVVIALLGGFVALFWVWATLTFLRRLRPASVQREGRVVLILPLSGAPKGLPDLLRALSTQTLPPARLIVAVEEGDAVAEAAMSAVPLPFPVTLVTAPLAPHRAQKCSNLLAGLADAAGERVVVMLDADILPQPWWLSTLASPALEGSADMVSGYRWLRPGGSLAAHLVAWTDRAFAMLPRSDRMPIAWGGSLALGPAALAEGRAARALERTLSDDLSLASMAAEGGLRLLMRRILLLPTPAEGPPRAILAFMIRQFRIVHLYRPALWWAGATAGQLAVLLWAVAALWQPVLLPLLCAAGAGRWWLHDRIGRRVGVADPPDVRWTQLILALTPLPDLFLAALGWASLRPRRIVWRHVTYEVAAPDVVRVLHRASP
ncbi:glycosyltransferase family 2 protein [Muricoccus radiodurans]|uniref:glycosyltransferase family 2 protein n=1 Tax=Muricoccus radiodurans TaxID=2231721 RepID=UPI003CE83E0A